MLLAGCGFELRKPPSFAFASIYLAVPPMSQLGLELQRALAASGGVSLVTDQRQVERADLVFELLQELREKVVVSINSKVSSTSRVLNKAERSHGSFKCGSHSDLMASHSLAPLKKMRAKKTQLTKMKNAD